MQYILDADEYAEFQHLRATATARKEINVCTGDVNCEMVQALRREHAKAKCKLAKADEVSDPVVPASVTKVGDTHIRIESNGRVVLFPRNSAEVIILDTPISEFERKARLKAYLSSPEFYPPL